MIMDDYYPYLKMQVCFYYQSAAIPQGRYIHCKLTETHQRMNQMLSSNAQIDQIVYIIKVLMI